MQRITYLLFCLLILTACNSRSSLTPEKAIIGHWQTEDGKIHMYVSDGLRISVVEGEKRGPYSYSKRSVNDKEGKISLLYSDPSFVESYTFNEDKTEMLQDASTVGTILFTEPRRWRYVDDKQSP